MNTPEIDNFDWYNISDYSISREIGTALKNLRHQQNLSQVELGEKAGLSRSAISEMENGKAATSFVTIIQVLRALNRLSLLDSWKSSGQIEIFSKTKRSYIIRKAKQTHKNKTKEENEWEWL